MALEKSFQESVVAARCCSYRISENWQWSSSRPASLLLECVCLWLKQRLCSGEQRRSELWWCIRCLHNHFHSQMCISSSGINYYSIFCLQPSPFLQPWCLATAACFQALYTPWNDYPWDVADDIFSFSVMVNILCRLLPCKVNNCLLGIDFNVSEGSQ